MELIAKITQYKISSRDKKLILVVVALAILFCAYRFVYYPNIQKAGSIREEIVQLQATKNELQKKYDKSEELKVTNETLKQEIQDMINHYGTGATTQKTIMFLEGLEKETGMEISVINFSEPEAGVALTEPDGAGVPAASNSVISDTTSQTGSSTASDSSSSTGSSTTDQGTSTQTDGSASTGSSSLANGKAEGQATAISGYNCVVSIDFKVSYVGLKDSIDYINNYTERMNIRELKMSYDMNTGNLSGTMLINMFQLANAGKAEEEPAIAGVSIGKNNIFGTIEVDGEENN